MKMYESTVCYVKIKNRFVKSETRYNFNIFSKFPKFLLVQYVIMIIISDLQSSSTIVRAAKMINLNLFDNLSMEASTFLKPEMTGTESNTIETTTANEFSTTKNSKTSKEDQVCYILK